MPGTAETRRAAAKADRGRRGPGEGSYPQSPTGHWHYPHAGSQAGGTRNHILGDVHRTKEPCRRVYDAWRTTRTPAARRPPVTYGRPRSQGDLSVSPDAPRCRTRRTVRITHPA